MTAPAKPADQAAAAAAPASKPDAIAAALASVREGVAKGTVPAKLEDPPVGGEAPAAGAEGGEPPAGEGGDVAAGAEGEAGAEGADGAAAGEGEGGEAAAGAKGEDDKGGDEPDPELVVELLPRKGAQPKVLVLEDKETAAELRASLRGAMRRDQARAALADVEQRENEVARIEDEITADPVLFVAERVGQRFHADIVRHLLSLPGVYDAVAEDLAEMQYDDRRQTVALRLENQRHQRRGQWDQDVRASAATRAQVRVVNDAIQRMIPEAMSDEDAGLLATDLRRDIAQYVTDNRVASLHPSDLPRIVERRLKQYGISRQDAEAALSVDAPPPVRGRSMPGARKPAGQGAPPDQAAARKTGADLQKRMDARRAAAAVPGPGAGAPPAAPALPAKQTIKERIQTIRQRIAGGA